MYRLLMNKRPFAFYRLTAKCLRQAVCGVTGYPKQAKRQNMGYKTRVIPVLVVLEASVVNLSGHT
jgi:hypothetical protein